MSRRRELSDEEETLWSGVARSIKPLRPIKTKAKSIKAKAVIASSPAVARTKTAVRDSPKPFQRAQSAVKQPPSLAALDRRGRKRVASGRDPIDARIDLHGKTQSEAHDALVRFVRRAQSNGARIVLVVTGKGSGTSRDGEHARGVLRRQVPLWLALPEFRSLILGFEEAHVTHGGEGALYVRLRRIR
jgi:DNA-nicking Smr family endonuclease